VAINNGSFERYYLYCDNFHLGWLDANALCQQGGYTGLAKIESSFEFESVLSLLSLDWVNILFQLDSWIGLNDIDNELTFVWSDGSLLGGYNRWSSFPNFNSIENCVKMRNDNGVWDLKDCSEKRNFVCSAIIP
jgi:hypothetical protein